VQPHPVARGNLRDRRHRIDARRRGCPHRRRHAARPQPALHIVVTGRDAPQELIDAADLVTEMKEIKHPFTAGIRAQQGIEF